MDQNRSEKVRKIEKGKEARVKLKEGENEGRQKREKKKWKCLSAPKQELKEVRIIKEEKGKDKTEGRGKRRGQREGEKWKRWSGPKQE